MSTTRSIRPALLGLLAIGLAVGAQSQLNQDHVAGAVVLYAVALAVMLNYFGRLDAAGLGTSRGVAQGPEPVAVSGRGGWWGLVGWLLVMVALVLTVIAQQQFYAGEPYAVEAWWFHLAAVMSILAAAYCFDGPLVWRGWRAALATWRRPAPAAKRAPWPLSSRTVFGWLALIMGVAALLRFFRFDSLPFGTWYDEAEYGLQALRILDIARFRPIFEGAINGPAHYLYLVAGSFNLFGVSTQAVRAVNAVMGIAAVPAAYMVGRELFDQRGGLMLAFLLAVASWALSLSRFGMHSTITTPLFALLAMAFLLKALRTTRLSDFAWTGFWLGVGLCFYTSYRVFLLVVALFLLHYVATTLLVERRLPPPRIWAGFFMLGLTLLLVVAPLVLFAQKHPELFWGRVQNTFIFSNKGPDERWPALWQNIRKHLLMFNWQGDPNGRHNLPGAPMLDSISGALMVLGVGMALWRIRQPRWALLLLWLGVGLLGGILSLDFEAPQSLRSNSSLPAAYALATVPLFLVWRAWLRGDGRYYPNAIAVPLIGLLLIPAAVQNSQRYFVQQATNFASWAAFSTAETITANLLNELDDQTDAYVISFYRNHPTLNFLAADVPPYARIETTDHFPMDLDPTRSALLVLDADRRGLFEEAKRLYPLATFQEHRPDFGGNIVLYSIQLTPTDIQSVQGLVGHVFPNATWDGAPVATTIQQNFDIDWPRANPLTPPFSVEWSGVLRAYDYGLYQFSIQAPGPTQLYIDEVPVLRNEDDLLAGLMLAEGNHAIRLRTAVPSAGDAANFVFTWRPPVGEPGVVPATALFTQPVRSNGLLGRYFANDAWRAPEAFARVDPQLDLYFHIPQLPRPYTVEWTGKIAIPETGEYGFSLRSIDDSALWIDDAPVAATPGRNQTGDGTLELEAGLHDMRIRFGDRTDHTNIHLYWTPPWGNRELIPTSVLFPPQADYTRTEAPTVAQLGAGSAGTGFWAGSDLSASSMIMLEGLGMPRGVAVGMDGAIYVAESQAARLLKVAGDGLPLAAIEGPRATPDSPERFEEPFDVATSQFGWVYVLDPAAARLSVFDSNGALVRNLPTDPAIFDRSRGLTVADGGSIWIAQTPTGRIVQLSPSGDSVQELAVWPGEDSQPVDVALAPDGSIYVTDAGLFKLVRFAPDGRRLMAWDLPRFNSIDGSHLAIDGAGNVYVTLPDTGQVAVYDAAGQELGRLALPAGPQGAARPVGIGVDAYGTIWVSDVVNGRLVTLERN